MNSAGRCPVPRGLVPRYHPDVRSIAASLLLLPLLAGCALVAPVVWTVEDTQGDYQLICRGVEDPWCSIQHDIGVELFRARNPDIVVRSVEVAASGPDGEFVVRVCGIRRPSEAKHCEITSDYE